MKLRFWKLSGAGNDFVLLDEKGLPARSLAALARRLCDRREGIGADGLLLVGKAGKNLRWRYHNADGSAAFCGNGARCAAWWMFLNGWAKSRSFHVQSPEGPMSARVHPGKNPRVSLSMPDPKGLRLGLKLEVSGRKLSVHFVDTGVPHAVVLVDDLERFPVLEAGRALRRHPAFSPAGANADFVALADGRLSVRTYERGVEAETLACGTGAVASAVVAAALGKARSPVPVFTRSGERLEVSFKRGPAGFAGVRLEGPARLVFQGEVSL